MTDLATPTPADPMDVHASPQQRVRVSGRRRLNLSVMGEGSPTVILATGANGGTLDWARVMPEVARSTKVVAFDRAGLGFSDPGPLPRTVSAIVADLRAALTSAHIEPPFILVGLSMGGLHMRHFAFTHPEEVVGLVMVDASTEGHTLRIEGAKEIRAWARKAAADLLAVERMTRAGTFTPETPEWALQVGPFHPSLTPVVCEMLMARAKSPTWWRAYRSEFRMFWRSAHEVANARRALGDMPLIVLEADQTVLPDWAVASIRRDIDEMTALSSRGVHRLVHSGHHIAWEDPAAVIAAVEEALATARSDASR